MGHLNNINSHELFVKLNKRIIFLAVAGFFIFAQFFALTQFSSAETENYVVDGKIWICHANSAADNRYSSNNVSINGLNGHGDHTGPYAASEEEAQAMKDAMPKIQWGDVIPPFEGFDGLNWDAVGAQEYWQENCNDKPPVDPDVPSVTLSAQKIVCGDEDLLPNLGVGGADIGPNTATNWVAENEGCELVNGWSFEYKTSGDQSNPGGSTVGPKGGGWKTFTADVDSATATAKVSIDDVSLIQTREVLPEGYIPFTDSDNDVSAEFYCHDNVLNYDNWEWIQNLKDGDTYYCIAWNVENVPEPTTATLNVQKIECLSESSLPNYGFGEDVTIGANTATNWVNQSRGNCALVPWQFQWQADPPTNPGDETGAAQGWTTFSNSVQIPTAQTSTIWVREVFNDDYIPFAGQITADSVSAEIYCHNDVLHYDNWERIDNIQAGGTYYCVAWNVPSNGEVRGLIYEDIDGDGIQESGEPNLENWNALLLTHNSPFKIVGIDITGTDGKFLFDNLTYGTYYVCQDLQSGWSQTELNAPGTGLDVHGLSVGALLGDSQATHDLVDDFCYEVELTKADPISDDNIFGDHRNQGVLGDNDEKDPPGEVQGDTTGGQGQGGQVLADIDTLATTGQPGYLNVIAGLALIGTATGLMILNRKSSKTE